jgi:hypothetical protein
MMHVLSRYQGKGIKPFGELSLSKDEEVGIDGTLCFRQISVTTMPFS